MTQTLRRIGILAAATLLTAALGMKPVYAIGTDESATARRQRQEQERQEEKQVRQEE